MENLTNDEINLLESGKRMAAAFKVSLKKGIEISVKKRIKNLNQKQTAALNILSEKLISRLTDEA